MTTQAIRQMRTGAELCVGPNLHAALSDAARAGIDLSGAHLFREDLRECAAPGVQMRRAYVAYSDFSGSDITRADFHGSTMHGVLFKECRATQANFSSTFACGSSFSAADLRGTNFAGADLHGSGFCGADMRGVNLEGAELGQARFLGTNIEAAAFRNVLGRPADVLPEAGAVEGWKKCADGVLVRLVVPQDARRSYAFSRSCRAEFVTVLVVIGADLGVSLGDPDTTYTEGGTVYPQRFGPRWWEEDAAGIHFFTSRAEAEAF